MPDLEKLSNILGADTIKKIYEDGASDSVKEVSKASVDLIKTLRLFIAPIQLLAAYQDRLSKYLDKVRNNVPEENQIEAPASISGPIIERLKYLEENNYLTDLYLNLLSRAIDKKRVNEAHPAFYHIIDQLSPDEAYILFELHDKEIDITVIIDDDEPTETLSPYEIVEIGMKMENLFLPNHFRMYVNHMKSLNLIRWMIDEEFVSPSNHDLLDSKGRIILTDFGKLFVQACIPTEGFSRVKDDDKNK